MGTQPPQPKGMWFTCHRIRADQGALQQGAVEGWIRRQEPKAADDGVGFETMFNIQRSLHVYD